MQTRGFLILVTENCLKPKSSHGGSYGVLWDLEDPRHQFWWHSVSDKLTASRRPWYLLYRLNSQGCVEKFRRAVFPFPFWLACSRSFSGFQDNWKTQFCSKKNEGDQRGKKSGIQFSGHSNSISINHFYKEIPWRNSYVHNYTPFLILGIHRRVFSDTPLKHSTGKKTWFENVSPILTKDCDLSSLEPTLFWRDISTRNEMNSSANNLLFLGPIGGPQFHQEGYPHTFAIAIFRISRKWMGWTEVRVTSFPFWKNGFQVPEKFRPAPPAAGRPKHFRQGWFTTLGNN